MFVSVWRYASPPARCTSPVRTSSSPTAIASVGSPREYRLEDRLEDHLVLRHVEVGADDDLEHVGDGVGRQQHAAEGALLGEEVVRRRALLAFGAGAVPRRRARRSHSVIDMLSTPPLLARGVADRRRPCPALPEYQPVPTPAPTAAASPTVIQRLCTALWMTRAENASPHVELLWRTAADANPCEHLRVAVLIRDLVCPQRRWG